MMLAGTQRIYHPGLLAGHRTRMGIGRLFGLGDGNPVTTKDIHIESFEYRYAEWKNDVPDTKITGISLKSQESKKTGYALGSTIFFDEQKVYTGSGKGSGGGFRGWITVTLSPTTPAAPPDAPPADQFPSGFTSWGAYGRALQGATGAIRSFRAQLENGTRAPDSPSLVEATALPAPGLTSVPPEITTAWNEYAAERDGIESSRQIGRYAWEARQQTSTPPVTPGGSTGTGIDSTGQGNDPGGGFAYPGAGGPYDPVYYQPTYSAGSIVTSPEVRAGTGTAYSDVGINPYVQGQQTTQEMPPTSRFTKKTAVVGAGGLLVVGGIVFFVLRRKKKKGRPSKSFPFGA